MGDHSRINSGTHRLPHIWPFIFTPYISPKSLFLPKNVTQSPIFFTLSRTLEIFHSKTPNRLKFEKKVPKCPYFYGVCHWKTPYLLPCIHMFVWGECCSLKHSEKVENLLFSKQNHAIWWILSGANLIKVMKIQFQFYRLNRPNCALWMNFIGRQGWCTGYYPRSQTHKGIYPTTTLYKSAHLALQTNAKRTWGCASGGILSVRCNAGKILKYRFNLRLYPVNFGNKLYHPCFQFDQTFLTPLYYGKLFGPPFPVTQNFFGPPQLPSPPIKVFMNAPCKLVS